MKGKRNIEETELRCMECNNKQKIQRWQGYKKKEGHIKHLYCFKCKDTTAHEEIKEGFSSMGAWE